VLAIITTYVPVLTLCFPAGLRARHSTPCRQDTESHAMFMASGDPLKAAFFRQDAIESPQLG